MRTRKIQLTMTAALAVLLLTMTGLTAQGVTDMPEVDSDERIDIQSEDQEMEKDTDDNDALDCDMEQRLLYADNPGVLIDDVFADSPAQKAGIMRGDIIVAVEGMDVSLVAEIAEILEGYDHGDEITITLLRGGEELVIDLTLETRVGYPLIGVVGVSKGYYKGNMQDMPQKMMPWGFDEKFDDKMVPDGPGFKFFHDKDGEEDGEDLDSLEIPEEVLEAVLSGNTALISEVVENSPADEAGMTANSVVIAINGDDLVEGDLAAAVLEYEVGDTVELTVGTFDGVEQIEVKLGENNGNPFLGVAYYPLNMGGGFGNFWNWQGPGNQSPGGKGMPFFEIPDMESN